MEKTQIEHLRKLYEDCNLLEEDIFTKKVFNKKANTSKDLVIITRSGVEKIVAQKKITYALESVCMTPMYACIKVTAQMDGATIQTFASAGPDNTTVSYYPEVAENRGISRAMIKLTKAHGLYSEDEFDEKSFTAPSAPQESNQKPNPVSEAMEAVNNRKKS